MKPLDGNWSPWSTIATPCFRPKTGQRVECGGGVQFRYRSCSNPTPRAGGKLCRGKDYDKIPCMAHSCRRMQPVWSSLQYLALICHQYFSSGRISVVGMGTSGQAMQRRDSNEDNDVRISSSSIAWHSIQRSRWSGCLLARLSYQQGKWCSWWQDVGWQNLKRMLYGLQGGCFVQVLVAQLHWQHL